MGGGGLITLDPKGGPPRMQMLVGRIEAEPEHHTVVKGSKIKYRFVLEARQAELKIYWDNQPAPGPSPAVEQFDKSGRTEHAIPNEIVEKLPANPSAKDIAPYLGWILIYESSKSNGAPAYEIVGRGTSEIEITWKHPGQHVLVARVAYFAEEPSKPTREQAETQILFTQRVSIGVQTIQKRRLTFAKGKPVPHPLEELDAMERYVEVIEAAEAAQPAPPHKQAEYQKQLEQSRKYRDALYYMFQHYRGSSAGPLVPCVASYASKDTADQVELRVCINERWLVKDNGVHFDITLIDWTNPLEDRLRGRYSGSGRDRAAAIQEAVSNWRKNCQYYHPGNVIGEVPSIHLLRSEPAPPAVPFAFDTPGKDFWDHLRGFFEAIGFLLATVALVITIITPIPGDEVVAGMIWAAVFASLAASGISIGRRKRNGFGDGSEDLFDVLTIVGNVFTAGRLGWARRALLVSRSFAGQFKQFFLFGEVGTDVLQGVLIAKEKINEFERILSDPALSPKERVDKMLELVRSAMVSGALLYTSVRAPKRPAKHGERPETLIDDATRARLQNPREVVDLDALKKQKADAAQGELKTKVQDQPQRGKEPPAKASTGPSPFPPRDPKVWKRHSITDNEIDLATKDGFKFNAYMDSSGHVSINIETKINGKHSPHLGTGRENFDRMFQHFGPNGRRIKGWHGMFVEDNYAELAKAKKANPKLTDKELVFESVTGKKFWKPWADANGRKITVEDAKDYGSFFSFSVKFD